MVSVECVKHRHAKFGGGFVFCHVMLLIILKPSCSNAIPIEYILCNVPDIHIVPFGFSTFLHNLIHFLLNLCFSSTLVPLSESLSISFQKVEPASKKNISLIESGLGYVRKY